MEIIETVKLKNLPQDIKLVETALSSSYGDFIAKNTEVILNEIHIIFIGGTPYKEIAREIK